MGELMIKIGGVIMLTTAAIMAAKATLNFISENNPIAIISGGFAISWGGLAVILLYLLLEDEGIL